MINQDDTEITPSSWEKQPVTEIFLQTYLKRDEMFQTYQTRLFWGVVAICIALYALFFVLIISFLCCAEVRATFINHHHLIAIMLSLLIVPSAILWGLVRAVFKVNQEVPSDTLKTVRDMYPFIG